MSNVLSFSIPALRVHQREDVGQAIYIGKVKAGDVYFDDRTDERFLIATWDQTSRSLEKGYQRIPNNRSIQKIKDYLLVEVPDPLLPTSVLVNSREKLKFVSNDVHEGFGLLEIDQPLYIIDGQHRIEAIKSMMKDPSIRKLYEDFELPIIVMSGFEYIKEVEEFFVINGRQRKVKTDLAERIYLELESSDVGDGLIPDSQKWKITAVKVVDRLRSSNEVPGFWNERIRLPDDGDDLAKTRLISQSSFVSSLKPLFIGANSIWSPKDEDRMDVIENAPLVLEKYWNGIAEIYPEIKKHPFDYSLFKTVGVFSLHLLLAYEEDNADNLDEAVKQSLEKIEYARDNLKLNIGFWRSGKNESRQTASSFSSASGHQRLAQSILTKQRM